VKVVLCLLPLLTSCVVINRLRPDHGCSVEPPASALAPTTTSRIDSLAGRFDLVMVTTSFPSTEGRPVWRTQLDLRRPDSGAVAAAVRRGLDRPRDLRLVGVQRWSTRYRPNDAEVDGTTLYLGCRGCLDASPDVLRITASSTHGFWGTWRDYQTGIGRVVGKNGASLPDPAGYFCALRSE
jgi:hypothetical protein